MLSLSVPSNIILWTIDYLASCQQFVDFNLSNLTLFYRIPQGTVLAPILHRLYTPLRRSYNASCSIVKFAEDTVLVGLIFDDDCSKYIDEVNKFATY